jgi:hypothetical protein
LFLPRSRTFSNAAKTVPPAGAAPAALDCICVGVAVAWGDNSRSAREPAADNCHQIPCKCSGKWVGIVRLGPEGGRKEDARGVGAPLPPVELASLAVTAGSEPEAVTSTMITSSTMVAPSPRKQRHWRTALCLSFAILYRNYTGVRESGFAAGGEARPCRRRAAWPAHC